MKHVSTWALGLSSLAVLFCACSTPLGSREVEISWTLSEVDEEQPEEERFGPALIPASCTEAGVETVRVLILEETIADGEVETSETLEELSAPCEDGSIVYDMTDLEFNDFGYTMRVEGLDESGVPTHVSRIKTGASISETLELFRDRHTESTTVELRPIDVVREEEAD